MALASGIEEPAELARLRAEFETLSAEVREHVRGSRSERARARRMMETLYARVFRDYREDADGIQDVLDRGEYNCVSGTLLSGLVARSLGLDAHVLATPRHLVLRLRLDGRARDVDTTSRRGPSVFGVPPVTSPQTDSRMWLGREIPHVRELDLEEAVAFVWHNRGQRALDQGKGLEAARSFREAWRIHAGLSDDSEGLASAMARAFRIEYEARAFDAALDVASIDLSIFPGRTTSSDRLQAATLKRIEALSDAGDPESAEEVLNASLELLGIPADRARLERAGSPIVARAAVRLRDWARAHRLAQRYALAEPDPAEGDRFLGWVERRHHDADGVPETGFCSDDDAGRTEPPPPSFPR